MIISLLVIGKLLLSDLTPLKSQNNPLKHLFNIFQINYKNEFKNIIKELIGKLMSTN